MLRIPGAVSNPHSYAGRSDLVEHFNQQKMGLKEVGFATELGVTGVLRLAERMPGIVTASPRRELDGITLSEVPHAFRAVRVVLNDILVMQDDRRMTRQANLGTLRARYSHAKEKRVECRHADRLSLAVPARAGKVQVALAERTVIQGERGFGVRRVLVFQS